jgi:hypothetical protein
VTDAAAHLLLSRFILRVIVGSRRVIVIVVTACGLVGHWATQRPAAQPLRPAYFSFSTDDVWLNLHHFLYVLGRARNGAPDATQQAVAGVAADERQGRATLTAEEQQTWETTVTAYANGLSRQPSMFQPPLAPITLTLAGTGDVAVPATVIDDAVRQTLIAAMPVYRKAWWPRHRAMNERYVATLQQQLDQDGPAIVSSLARSYGLTWPARPYPTHVVPYASWQGGFSYTGLRIVVSSNDYPMNRGWYPLEILFHEAMHQWDDDVARVLQAHATARQVRLPIDLSHTLVFVTAADAVRRLHPEHVAFIDALNLWSGSLSGSRLPAARLRPAIEATWKPYLDGRGERDDVFAAMVAAAAAVTP